MEDIVGPVLPRTVTETHTGGAGTLILRRPPVISVTAVVENGTTPPTARGRWTRRRAS
ncbi:hypothetical protein V2I01_04850 [Micromonospora sp. BRA006-A]|nr:hypothetical protein [Micromonospora sp. BRA006-A]